MKRVLIKVTGSVQGVCYRRFALQKAQQLGLTGYVENQEDHTVQILAQGSFPAVDNFIQWCHLGSPQSQVDHVLVEEDEADEIYLDFSIQ